jgi:hypothetical protein
MTEQIRHFVDGAPVPRGTPIPLRFNRDCTILDIGALALNGPTGGTVHRKTC